MIISRENRQRRNAEAYNRERLLKLGFTHLSLSVFTNKYYAELNQTAQNHNEKSLIKKYFNLLCVKILISKRIRIVKSTGFQMYRKNSLLKAMRHLYSFHSLRKDTSKKLTQALNYHTSNLFLKTLVS